MWIVQTPESPQNTIIKVLRILLTESSTIFKRKKTCAPTELGVNGIACSASSRERSTCWDFPAVVAPSPTSLDQSTCSDAPPLVAPLSTPLPPLVTSASIEPLELVELHAVAGNRRWVSAHRRRSSSCRTARSTFRFS